MCLRQSIYPLHWLMECGHFHWMQPWGNWKPFVQNVVKKLPGLWKKWKRSPGESLAKASTSFERLKCNSSFRSCKSIGCHGRSCNTSTPTARRSLAGFQWDCSGNSWWSFVANVRWAAKHWQIWDSQNAKRDGSIDATATASFAKKFGPLLHTPWHFLEKQLPQLCRSCRRHCEIRLHRFGSLRYMH